MSKRSHNSANRRPSSKRSNGRCPGASGAVRLTSATELANLALRHLPSIGAVNYAAGRTYPCIQIDCDEGQLVFFEAGNWGPYFSLFGGPANDPSLWGTYVLKLSAGPVCLVCVDHLLRAARTGVGGSARVYRARAAQVNQFSVTNPTNGNALPNGHQPASTSSTSDLGRSSTTPTSEHNSGPVVGAAHETTLSPAGVSGQENPKMNLDAHDNLGLAAHTLDSGYGTTHVPVVADILPCAAASRRTHTTSEAPETVLDLEDVLAGGLNFGWGPPHQRRFLCAIRGLSCIEPRLDAVRRAHIVKLLSGSISRTHQRATLNFLQMCFAEIIDVGWWTAPNPADGIDLATVPKAIWRTRHVAKRLPTGT